MPRRPASPLAALLAAVQGALAAAASAAEPMPAFHPDDRVLFQGDSITDGNRGRNQDPNHILGHGYAFIISARFGAALPERHLSFINRGVSGNKVTDLAKRWKTDALDLAPTILSILIGINDLNGGVTPEAFEQQYAQLLDETEQALPAVRLVLLEPFGLEVGHFKGRWPQVRADLEQRQAAVARLGAKHHAPVVHLQQVFDQACARAPADYWIWDGVHPTYAGHQLIADAWVQAVEAAWPGAAAK